MLSCPSVLGPSRRASASPAQPVHLQRGSLHCREQVVGEAEVFSPSGVCSASGPGAAVGLGSLPCPQHPVCLCPRRGLCDTGGAIL